MSVFNQNLTEKEKNLFSEYNTRQKSKNKDKQKIMPAHHKSKSYHIDAFSGENLLGKEKKNVPIQQLPQKNIFNNSEENFINEKSSSININNINNNNEFLDKFDALNNSVIFEQNNINFQIDNNDFADFNISDEKFIKFLDGYLHYLDKNQEFSYDNRKDESIYSAINIPNEIEGANLFHKILQKYKRKCFDYHNLQKGFWKHVQNFKSIEKSLQKARS